MYDVTHVLRRTCTTSLMHPHRSKCNKDALRPISSMWYIYNVMHASRLTCTTSLMCPVYMVRKKKWTFTWSFLSRPIQWNGEKKIAGPQGNLKTLKNNKHVYIFFKKPLKSLVQWRQNNTWITQEKKTLVIPHTLPCKKHTATSSTDQGGTTNSNGPELFEESIFFH